MGPEFLAGIAVVLAVIGGLEIVDRTSFALITLATRAPARPTWIGGAAAFVLTTVIAVTAGAALVDLLGRSRLPWLRVAGGLFLLGYAGWLAVAPHRPEEPRPMTDHRSAFATAFLTILLLELGDTTMIFEIVFVADYGWLIVLVAGSLALVSVAAWDVFLGQRLGERLSEERLRVVVVVALVAIGVATILYGVAPALFPALSVGVGA
ncbi:MAG TPA: TMEM165/GDT1 family protein [Thermoplasmata archaeon]|nr:TMEM165/GDT1 family protein [Thermoplasmata archaeon]